MWSKWLFYTKKEKWSQNFRTADFFKNCFSCRKMLIKEQEDEVCDATMMIVVMQFVK
jgi:hypothetical protein